MDKETIEQIQVMHSSLEKLKTGEVNQIVISEEQSKSLESLVVAYMSAAAVDDAQVQKLLIDGLDKIWDNFVVVN